MVNQFLKTNMPCKEWLTHNSPGTESEKKTQSPTLKKVNLTPRKIYFEIETSGRNHNQGTLWIFNSMPLYG